MHLSHFRHYIIEISHRHKALVIVQTLVAISNTLANSFALIYLVSVGESYAECALYVLICAAVPAVIVAFAAKPIVSRFPASITTALICLGLYYVSLMFLEEWYLILIPPMLFGTYIATFWVPYNALVMHITSRRKRGAIVGAYFLIFPLVSAVMPLVGGAILALWSYDVLFAAGALVALADLLYVSGYRVLLGLRERVIIPELLQSLKVSLVSRFRMDLDFSIIDRRLRWALFAEGIQDGVFWIFVPIVSLEFAASEAEVGGYLSLFAIWGGIMTITLGYLSDRLKDRATIVRVGAAFGAVSTLLAAQASTPATFASSMSMAYFWIAMVPSFLFTMLLDKLERHKKKGVLVREFLLNTGRVLGIAVALGLILLGLDLASAMTFAGIALATIIIVRD